MAKTARMSTSRRIEVALTEEIAAGELAPGTRLDEVRLAARFDASRTPVREALGRLAAQGILIQGEKRGVFVAEYSREELAQIFEAMHEIEAACARMAAQRLSLLSRTEIETAQADCVSAAEKGDRAAYLRANEAFHQAIYRATGNPYFAEIASEFRQRTGPFRAKKFATKEDLIVSAQNHEALINDIFSEDSGVASNSMRTHMETSFLQVLKVN
ncbi:MAG: GntR family transcriptional regulator [Pseudomonadota bacterium]|uniref:GntR family transcriptional regulator n=1 Tax=Thalassovita sp. TaxID=1979401 RepID=UPI002AB0E2A0|nr:GntR family transcriptional regulator [Thalassovita sp.]MEC7964242.1 GntR family transcriptional regulator [Pseudomonadota bacterium]MEC8039228.1 GntR family transcriptional regulator [Pseudomonadota bacterium]MEC8293647.1 GntR family transcriptional regulator [Pseudomonadota bacterium]